MSTRVIRINAESPEELEDLQDKVIELVKTECVDVTCYQRLDLPPNGKCMCGSGRKWKKCCMWEASTTVTFFHNGPPQQRRTRATGIGAAMAWAGILTMGGI